jgi:diguanylate cyclase (GGDEF)-like protein
MGTRSVIRFFAGLPKPALLFCRHAASSHAIELAERLREAIAAVVVEVSSGTLRVTASLACATLDETDGSIEGLIALADKRLYSAKHAGRNRVFVSESQVA